MSLCLDPIIVPLFAILVWPLSKSLVLVCAAAISVWSRDMRRRAAARHLVWLLGHSPEEGLD